MLTSEFQLSFDVHYLDLLLQTFDILQRERESFINISLKTLRSLARMYVR